MSIDIQEVKFCEPQKYVDLHFVSEPQLVELVTDGETLLARIRGRDECDACIQLDFTYEVLCGLAEQAKSLMSVRLALHENSQAFVRYDT